MVSYKITSKWKLVYCFSKRLSVNDIAFNQMLNLLKKSIEYNRRFHNLKLFTDAETFEYIKEVDIDVTILDTPLFFLDDFKIKVLSKLEENEVLIDIDIFLYDTLNVDTDCDLFADHVDNSMSQWYVDDFEKAKQFKFSNLLYLPTEKSEMTNIGILKFFNTELLKKYIESYNNIRNIALSEIDSLPKFPAFSILLGQLLLRNIIDKNGYIVKYGRKNRKNKYIHLAGPWKYNDEWVQRILRPIDLQTKLI